MEVARATSPPIWSSIRRSTPMTGDAAQSSEAPCTDARSEKSALRSMATSCFRRSGRADAGTRGHAGAPGFEMHELGRHVDFDGVGDAQPRKGRDVGHRKSLAGQIGLCRQHAVEIAHTFNRALCLELAPFLVLVGLNIR